jgi:ABC-2 type transport system ATP-binding protein
MAIIEVEHLHKRYGETVAVSDVSFAIEEGERPARPERR